MIDLIIFNVIKTGLFNNSHIIVVIFILSVGVDLFAPVSSCVIIFPMWVVAITYIIYKRVITLLFIRGTIFTRISV